MTSVVITETRVHKKKHMPNIDQFIFVTRNRWVGDSCVTLQGEARGLALIKSPSYERGDYGVCYVP